jgi:hypothetical protein
MGLPVLGVVFLWVYGVLEGSNLEGHWKEKFLSVYSLNPLVFHEFYHQCPFKIAGINLIL